jgi:hypothetical protein
LIIESNPGEGLAGGGNWLKKPEAERRGIGRNLNSKVSRGHNDHTSERRRFPMKWRVLYALMIVASIIAAAGAPTKWH